MAGHSADWLSVAFGMREGTDEVCTTCQAPVTSVFAIFTFQLEKILCFSQKGVRGDIFLSHTQINDIFLSAWEKLGFFLFVCLFFAVVTTSNVAFRHCLCLIFV